MTRLLAVLLLSLITALPASGAELKPNILFILADDLGWADTTLYGHTKFYQTPNLERLAKRGDPHPQADLQLFICRSEASGGKLRPC